MKNTKDMNERKEDWVLEQDVLPSSGRSMDGEAVDGCDWVRLLTENPSLSTECDASHGWGSLNAFDWRMLLSERPQFLKRYRSQATVELSSSDWCEILKKQPQLVSDCPAADGPVSPDDNGKTFSFCQWLEIVREQPCLESSVPWEEETVGDDVTEPLLCSAWLRLIADHPRYAQRFDWRRAASCTDGSVWQLLLTDHVEYEAYCPWESLEPIDWWMFFKYLPNYFEKCPCPTAVPARAWAYLLCRRPELAARFDRWSELTAAEWSTLLRMQPQLSAYCPCLSDVKAQAEDDWNPDGLTFPCGMSHMDVMADMDYHQVKMEVAQHRIENMIDSLMENMKTTEENISQDASQEGDAIASHGNGIQTESARTMKEFINQDTMRLAAGYPAAKDILPIHCPDVKDRLFIDGGWGYDKEDAVVLHSEESTEFFGADMDAIDQEKLFIQARLLEEMEWGHDQRYDGLKWERTRHDFVMDDNGVPYDRETVVVSLWKREDWTALKADWESHDGYRDDEDGRRRHDAWRKETCICFTAVFWFDLTYVF